MENAKEAYVLAGQLAALQQEMEKAQSSGGYAAFAKTYSTHLVRAKEILKSDSTILGSIQHLQVYDHTKPHGYAKDFMEMKVDLSVLRSALNSFFELNFPPQEKKKLGFSV